MMPIRSIVHVLLAAVAGGLVASAPDARADAPYLRASPEVRAVLDAPPPPTPFVSPTAEHVVLARSLLYPPISDLAEPMLPLAGIRINPRNNGPHGIRYFVGLTLKKLPDGAERPIALPPAVRIHSLRWNPDGSLIAFANQTATSVELWVLDVRAARARRVPRVRLNPVLDYTFSWMPDGKTLLVKMVPTGGKPRPTSALAPTGPYVEETAGTQVASSTYEARDLLKTPHDADRFEYHATSQLALVQVGSGRVTPVGSPAVFSLVARSPDGRYILVERIGRPYSYLRPYDRFPTKVDLWDLRGVEVERVADLPLADQVPIHGERTGPREFEWRSTAPATLLWVEALDGGDTYKKVPFHDRLMLKPVGGRARELMKTTQRFSRIHWIEGGGRALVTEIDLDTHRTRTSLVDVDAPSIAPRTVWDRSQDDRYGHPGDPVPRVLPSGAVVVRVQGGSIYLRGAGASPAGDRPFLDRMDLTTLRTERLFRSTAESFESFVAWLDPAAGAFLTSRESPLDPPNLHVRTLTGAVAGSRPAGEAVQVSTARVITRYVDPTPQLRRLGKRLVTYKRRDGLPLSFTLYVPPDYKPGTRLPTVLWAYPLDYTDPSAAGQVAAAPNKFTFIAGPSPLFLALAGYAVLQDVAMPVVGPSETAYDTFVEQIRDNAKAAIAKAVELGVADPDRVAVMGHSHGALMTANLLAWTDLFRTGVARSGAYNHTLRPFGFQRERRTLYKAQKTYLKLSPLINAERIDEPLLLIHGEIDANPGTVTLQSQKLFEAVRGVGGTARLLILPLESHGYLARESNEHVIAETEAWLDKHLKNAPPRHRRPIRSASTKR